MADDFNGRWDKLQLLADLFTHAVQVSAAVTAHFICLSNVVNHFFTRQLSS